MNKNFKTIIFLAGKFGIVIREHVESLIYTNKYSHISANRTLSKLVLQGYLKRIDRGKRKTDGYKLTNEGMKLYKKLFGEEPKNYNSGDKLHHSIQIVNFYIHIINDLKKRYNIIEEINLMDEKRLYFHSERQIKFIIDEKSEIIIPDGFFIYNFEPKRGKVAYLEIENSNRNSRYVAQKTLNNYERYFLSRKWKKEFWQKKGMEIFPYILIVSYSEYKTRELIKQFNNKIKLKQLSKSYLFTDYSSLKENGISGKNWYNLSGEKVSLL